jgi:hypothetical protein
MGRGFGEPDMPDEDALARVEAGEDDSPRLKCGGIL